jgi:hypothetical protein
VRVAPRTLVSVVPDHVQVDRAGQPVVSGATEVGFPWTPVSAPVCARLRRRAVWVRRMEKVIGKAPGCVGKFLRGRWTPDLPSPALTAGANLVLSHLPDGVRILGGGSVQGRGKDDEETVEAYLVVELADGSRVTVYPELLCALSSYAFLRERSAVLLSSLRLRALEWCRARGLSKTSTWAGLPGSLMLAWEVCDLELWAQERLSDGPEPPFWWSSSS